LSSTKPCDNGKAVKLKEYDITMMIAMLNAEMKQKYMKPDP
jgi:hypothetical protein